MSKFDNFNEEEEVDIFEALFSRKQAFFTCK